LKKKLNLARTFPLEWLQVMLLIRASAETVTGIDDEVCGRISFKACASLRRAWGGKQIYFPRVNLANFSFCQALRSAVIDAGKAEGIDSLAASVLANDAGERVFQHYKGSQVYLPKGTGFDCARRDAYIVKEFLRVGLEALADRFGISERQVYNIVKRTQNGR
jgi:Mor family transcriptional regulator